MEVLPTEYVAPRYAARFRCIGSDCEETCCSGWQVAVDESHYHALEQQMSGSAEERGEFARSMRRNGEKESGKHNYALVVLNEASQCSFLTRDRLCSVQKRYGGDLLSDTCAIYPRHVGLVDRRVELTAKTSCPEVARLLLLSPDALTLVDVPDWTIERGAVHRSVPASTADPYLRAIDDVRATILRILGDDRYPFASRLAIVGCLADELTPAFYRGVEQLDANRLLRVLERAEADDTGRRIHEEFASLDIPDAFAKTIVLRVLASRMHTSAGSFGQLVLSVFSHVEAASAAGFLQVDGEKLRLVLRRYSDSKRHCEATFGARLDMYFSNYAMNYFLQDWYTSSPSLAVHTQNLLLRLAILRFLLLCHPDVARPPSELDEETLDRAAVEVFYKFSRGVEHNPQFLRLIEKDFQERASGLAHAMFLSKF